jgi:monovalent cation:proton antiporter-2 (CPA2) family protein
LQAVILKCANFDYSQGMHDFLNITLILLTTAVLVVVLFRRINMPPILGYLMVGVVIGPHSLGWVPDTAETRYLAEIGVVFLMFSIGLEFSLAQLMTMRRLVLGLGGAQVVVTMLLALSIALAAGLSWQVGLILGGVVAMSSTAILSKVLADSLQLHSAHGRQIMGVLLFQDLAVVPLLVLIPALALPAEAMAAAVSLALLKAAVVLTLILFVGQRVMRPLFTLIAAQKSSELFVLAVLLVTLGLAWMTELAGLSLALGAFMAGMLISETEYRYQVEDYIKPFRDVLLGLFFVTIGMLLDITVIVDRWVLVALVLLALVALKFFIIFALSRLFGSDRAVAMRRRASSDSCCWPLRAASGCCRRTRFKLCWRPCCFRCWPRRSFCSIPSALSSSSVRRNGTCGPWRCMTLRCGPWRHVGTSSSAAMVGPGRAWPAFWKRRTSAASPSIPIRNGCVRPRPQASRSSLAMPAVEKC